MLGTINIFWKFLRERNPREKMRLRSELEASPMIGKVIRKAQKIKAACFQRSAQAYVKMQKKAYEMSASADVMSPGKIDGDHVVGSWQAHDAWPDYNDYLMKHVPRNQSWMAIEYGCGPGRNIRKWSEIFVRIDGVDISKKNLENAKIFLNGTIPPAKMPNLYVTEGMNCGDAQKNHYDFAFSTICLQHICVYEVRLSILKNLYECLKLGGVISIQMGYGVPSPGTVSYYENHFRAIGTNSVLDVAIGSPDEVQKDLEGIGFRNFEYWIRPVGPGDDHPHWIFFTAVKPN
jgi:SAM-dependent methyltransferase